MDLEILLLGIAKTFIAEFFCTAFESFLSKVWF